MADPRQTLQDLIRRFGTSLAEEPQRCKGMLMDLCGSSRREIAGLVAAIEEKITTELMKPGASYGWGGTEAKRGKREPSRLLTHSKRR
jgi:hypothetical protein